jgi:Cu-Zn family superoxide dismutase
MTFETQRISRPEGRALRRRRFVLGAAAPLAAACFLALAGCEPDDDVSSVTDTTIEDEAATDTAMTEEAWRRQVSPDYREPETTPDELPPGYPHTREDEGTMDEGTDSLAEDGSALPATKDHPAQAESRAVAEVQPVGNSELEGQLQFRQEEDLVRITGELRGLEAGMHTLYLQPNGSCDGNLAESAGDEAAAQDDSQGAAQAAPDEGDEQAEDLGSFLVAEDGSATVDIIDAELSLDAGPDSLIGKTLIVQATVDTAQPTADSGTPVGCAEIQAESFAQATGS